ncbi:hypothetical protein [Aeromonas sp. SG16]|uniref:hypothetical protein n=1 Tax=Aeromonas sp. SG16 TaxID=2950548 RepID=UPI00210A1F8B|nr:hypothetical protein [Aeromonas sp. SG16]MCQ4054260.1 hypothetical protein [Aeromonas sp. SG16]
MIWRLGASSGAQPAQADSRFCGLLVSGDDMAGGVSSGAQPAQADSRFCKFAGER